MAGRVSVFWQLPQLTILAVGEVLVSVTGLEFAYATSPDRLKAFLMAVYLLTTAAGDLLGGFLYSTAFSSLNMATVMYVCALLMLSNLVLFVKVAHWWEQHQASDWLRVALLDAGEHDGDDDDDQQSSQRQGHEQRQQHNNNNAVELVTPRHRIV